MTLPYDPSQPIDAFYKRIEDCQKFAEEGGVKISNDQTLQTAYHLLHASGLYNDACKE